MFDSLGIFICLLVLQKHLYILVPPLPLRTVLRPSREAVSRLKSSVMPQIKHNSQHLGSAFFSPSTDFCFLCPFVLGLNEVQRWWARTRPIYKHLSFTILLFLYITPYVLVAPGIMSRSPHSRTLMMSHCLSFSIFSGFSLRIQSPWFSFLFCHLYPRTNSALGVHYCKKKCSHRACILVERDRQENKRYNRRRLYNWSLKGLGLGALTLCTVRNLSGPSVSMIPHIYGFNQPRVMYQCSAYDWKKFYV